MLFSLPLFRIQNMDYGGPREMASLGRHDSNKLLLYINYPPLVFHF